MSEPFLQTRTQESGLTQNVNPGIETRVPDGRQDLLLLEKVSDAMCAKLRGLVIIHVLQSILGSNLCQVT